MKINWKEILNIIVRAIIAGLAAYTGAGGFS